MIDKENLKRLAEACPDEPLRLVVYHGNKMYLRNTAGIVFEVYRNPSFPQFAAINEAHARLAEAATPAVLLALLAENAELRKDKDRLDALESSFWDVRHTSDPIGDSGDSSVSIEIVGSWMDEPRERVIGEDYNENLRAAIDQAMKAPAYPPARPEYEYEIPDFGPGNGNRARRRAESMGIDYTAAMKTAPMKALP
jgi:hypothetical protein